MRISSRTTWRHTALLGSLALVDMLMGCGTATVEPKRNSTSQPIVTMLETFDYTPGYLGDNNAVQGGADTAWTSSSYGNGYIVNPALPQSNFFATNGSPRWDGETALATIPIS